MARRKSSFFSSSFFLSANLIVHIANYLSTAIMKWTGAPLVGRDREFQWIGALQVVRAPGHLRANHSTRETFQTAGRRANLHYHSTMQHPKSLPQDICHDRLTLPISPKTSMRLPHQSPYLVLPLSSAMGVHLSLLPCNHMRRTLQPCTRRPVTSEDQVS